MLIVILRTVGPGVRQVADRAQRVLVEVASERVRPNPLRVRMQKVLRVVMVLVVSPRPMAVEAEAVDFLVEVLGTLVVEEAVGVAGHRGQRHRISRNKSPAMEPCG